MRGAAKKISNLQPLIGACQGSYYWLCAMSRGRILPNSARFCKEEAGDTPRKSSEKRKRAGRSHCARRKITQTGEGVLRSSPVGVSRPVFWSIRKSTILL